jgi:hypothetical protein
MKGNRRKNVRTKRMAVDSLNAKPEVHDAMDEMH